MMVSLTLPIALDIARRACREHRADILLTSPEEWARSRIERPGLAWAFVSDSPMVAGGVLDHDQFGLMWLAGCEGWTRYVRHVVRMWKSIVSSGLYKRYLCEVHEFDHLGRRFAERIGFTEMGTRNGFVSYGMVL